MADGLTNIDDGEAAPDNSTFVSWYETWHHNSIEWRERWEDDRWFYFNRQWTTEQIKELASRGQAANVYNEIKPVIDFLVGLEKQQRTDPRAFPRTPLHEQDAEAATDALRFVAEREEYDDKRSGVWFDLLTIGFGGMELVPVRRPNGEIELELSQNDWDRMWWDVHSAKPDFEDAAYRGLVRWLDFDDAVFEYGEENKEKLEAAKLIKYADDTMHDDKPRSHRWYDAKEKRVCVCIVYYQKRGVWHFAEFTGGEDGLLKYGPSPIVDEDGASTHPYEWMSAHIDPDNERSGLVRELKDRQLEINKRASKLLHHLNVRQLFYKKGAIVNVRALKRELAKPDGAIELAEHAKWGEDVGLIDNNAEVVGHFQLLQDAKESIRRIGASSSLRGQEGPEKSGVAIQAKQQANLIELGALLDRLRVLDRHVFRKMWMGIRQFWTAPKWVRVTDDERNVRFVGLNVPPQIAQMAQAQGVAPDQISFSSRPVAQMDVDIIIEDAPDIVTLAGEQFEQLVALASAGVVFPPEIYLRAAPNLRNKDALLEILQQQAAAPNPETEAGVNNTNADTQKKIAEAKKTEIEAMKTFAEAMMGPEPREPQTVQ